MFGPLWAAPLLISCVVLTGCRHESHARVSRDEAREVLANNMLEQVPRWKRVQRLPKNAVAGARVFAQSGCTTCHTYLRSGGRNLGASDLSRVGRRHGVRFFERYVAEPARYRNRVMPPFSALGRARLHELALFLAASKGSL